MSADQIRALGKSSAEVMARVLPPMVHREDIAAVIGYVEGVVAPSAVVPHFIGQRYHDTVAGAWYLAYGVAAGNWTLLGATSTPGAPGAGDPVVLDANGGVAIPGAVVLDGNTAIAGGAGISLATAFKTSVVKEGGIITTRLLIDLEGLNGGGTAGDIIGNDGAGVAFLTQITAAKNGAIIGGTVVCLELPAGSNVDVDIWSADEATGVEDTAISALSNEVQLINHGNWAAAQLDEIELMPVANQYLYLTSGAATAGAFTAGKFLITLYGV